MFRKKVILNQTNGLPSSVVKSLTVLDISKASAKKLIKDFLSKQFLDSRI